MAKSEPGRRLRLRPANPFDLIRLLARSQHDPRKALAELVQNSLDAGAARVDLHWFNEKGSRALRLREEIVGGAEALSGGTKETRLIDLGTFADSDR